MQTTTDVYADVYLFTRDEGTWILLLDATSDSVRRQTMQQKLYDARLQAVEFANESDTLLRANLSLEQLVRERTAELAQTVLRLQQELAAKTVRRETNSFALTLKSRLLSHHPTRSDRRGLHQRLHYNAILLCLLFQCRNCSGVASGALISNLA